MTWWVLQNLVVTAALAAGVWVFCRFGRVGPVARHALWLVVLAKMLTPPLVSWPWAVASPLGREAARPVAVAAATGVPVPVAPAVPADVLPPIDPLPAVPSVDMQPVATDATDPVPFDVPAAVADADPALPLPQPDASVTPTPPATPTFILPPVSASPAAPPAPAVLPPPEPDGRPRWSDWLRAALGLGWAVGTTCFAAIQCGRVARMLRLIRRGTPADEEMTALVADVAATIDARPVRVRVVPGLGSPAVFSILRPVLLWPAELPASPGNKAARGLIAHELAHVRRRDHWVGWMELAAGAVWWWSPLYWYVRHQLRENAELAADGWVVQAMPGGRRAYAEGLLAVCECVSGRPAPRPAVGAGAGGRRFLERRLAMIMRDRVSLRLPRAGLAAVLVLGLSALPAWSLESLPAEPTAKPEPTATGRVVLGGGGTLTLRLASDSPQPPEVRALLQQFQADEAAARAAAMQQAALRKQILLSQLTRLLAHYDSLGDARASTAIRAQIQSLGGEGGTRRTSPATARPQPDPGNLTSFRGQTGQTFLFTVTGRTSGWVWGGPEAYTDDSDLGTAAVHAGVLQPNQQGVVRVRVLPGREHYDGSTRNGVTSSSYGSWTGSYAILPTAASGADVRPDPGTLYEFRGKTGMVGFFRVTGSTTGTVWGSDVYTDDSSLATAAVHAGALKANETGVVRVTILPGRDSYEGCERNGVTTRPYAAFGGSFRVERAPNSATGTRQVAPVPPVPTAPPIVPVRPRTFRNPYLPNVVPQPQPQPPVPTAPPQPAGPSAEPSAYRGRPGVQIMTSVVGTTEGSVWGTDIYTDDSSVAAAAVHAGLVKPGEAAKVVVTILPGRSSYAGSSRNGVTSTDYGTWYGSFVLDRADAPGALTAPGTGGLEGPRTGGPADVLRLRAWGLDSGGPGTSAKIEREEKSARTEEAAPATAKPVER